MTPAIRLLQKAGVDYTLREYQHDPRAVSYGLEAAEKLGLEPDRVFKTLVAELDDGSLVVAILPVSRQLDFKALARASGARKAHLAELTRVEKTTGYVAGGVSPLGQKKRLPSLLDESARQLPGICVSGGRRGLDIELAPARLKELCNADYAALAKD